MVDVMVVHERDRRAATTVVIEGSVSEGSDVLAARAREHLRVHDYETYRFVTERPRPPVGGSPGVLFGKPSGGPPP